jgi:hypothetical protein
MEFSAMKANGLVKRGLWGAALLMPLALLLSGCASWSYEQIQLGQSPKDYERVLPVETSRKTALGLCHLGQGRRGYTDALVVLLTDDRRVAGKLWARKSGGGRRLGRGAGGFRLVGELDPGLCGVAGSGPLDTLRAIAAELTDYRGEKLAQDAHGWVAAGLVRLMQRWPGVRDVGVSSQWLDGLLERVPGGGTARLEIDERGIYHLEYEQGGKR